MEVTIMMSLPVFDGFIDKCDEASHEFAILKNGVIVRGAQMLAIRCDIFDADRLGFLATKVYPEAVDKIAKAITAARKSATH